MRKAAKRSRKPATSGGVISTGGLYEAAGAEGIALRAGRPFCPECHAEGSEIEGYATKPIRLSEPADYELVTRYFRCNRCSAGFKWVKKTTWLFTHTGKTVEPDATDGE